MNGTITKRRLSQQENRPRDGKSVRVFEDAVDNVVDVRISFPSLETEAQCLTIRQYVQAKEDK